MLWSPQDEVEGLDYLPGMGTMPLSELARCGARFLGMHTCIRVCVCINIHVPACRALLSWQVCTPHRVIGHGVAPSKYGSIATGYTHGCTDILTGAQIG